VSFIERLHIEGLRNLEYEVIFPGRGINIFFGANGAGKTSVLESISFLFTAKSFRTSRVSSLISSGAEYCCVRAVFESKGDRREAALMRNKTGFQSSLDGERLGNLSTLSRLCPVLIFEPSTFDILRAAPVERRKVYEWMMFHVEHGYMDAWKSYFRVLEQRNQLLKRNNDSAELNYWTQMLIEAGSKLTAMRSKHFDRFLEMLQNKYLGSDITGIGDLEIRLRSGWSHGLSLQEVMHKNKTVDIRFGSTQAGPHRFDLYFSDKKKPLAEILSRGQSKIFISAFRLAQARYVSEVTGRQPLILMDDFLEELDPENTDMMLDVIRDQGFQCLVSTAKMPEKLDRMMSGRSLKAKVFHVEHGKIRQQV
jgi:DNA replication and repair protein RecF